MRLKKIMTVLLLFFFLCSTHVTAFAGDITITANVPGSHTITVDADGRFVPKRVAVFQASQGITALRSGLAEGEKVVSSGLFLIDSEANISGALERMRSESATHAH